MSMIFPNENKSSRVCRRKLLLMATVVAMICPLAGFAQLTVLDRSFGDTGVVISSYVNGGASVGESVALQPDGKIVLAGFSYNLSSVNSAFTVARYDTNGNLDSTFGKNGFARIFISGGDSMDEGFSVAIQQDGKIVVAGFTKDPKTNYPLYAVARLNPNGTADSTFGENGTAMTVVTGGDKDDRAYALLVQLDGKIIVAGDAQDQSYYASFAAVRFNTNGTIDSTFGTNGSVRTSINGSNGMNDWGTSAALQSDGKIVIAGYSECVNSLGGHYWTFSVARLNSRGTLDSSFGSGGSTRISITGGVSFDYCRSVAIQPDGKIVLAGASQDPGNKHTFAVARLNEDGTTDYTFGNSGSARNYIFGGDSTYDDAHSVAIQSDGKIVASGLSTNKMVQAFAVTRYDQDGTPDRTFGTNGTVRTMISTTQDQGSSVAIQSDGKIVVGGVANGTIYSGMFTIVRYLPENLTNVRTTSTPVAKDYVLHQNYPNPFNPSTVIAYQLPTNSFVKLKIFDVLGREVKTMVDGEERAGYHNVSFDANGLSSGVYYYRLTADGFISTKKMLLIK